MRRTRRPTRVCARAVVGVGVAVRVFVFGVCVALAWCARTIDGAGVAGATPRVPKGVPNVNDSVTRARVRCNACAASADALREDLRALVTRKTVAGVRRVDIVEAVDATCERVGEEYGLLMRDDKTTEVFTEGFGGTISRARGSWITQYVREECGRLIDGELDDVMFEMSVGMKWERDAWRTTLCSRGTRACAGDDKANRANGAVEEGGRDEAKSRGEL